MFCTCSHNCLLSSGDAQDGVRDASESLWELPGALWEIIWACWASHGALENATEAPRAGLGTLLETSETSIPSPFFPGRFLWALQNC